MKRIALLFCIVGILQISLCAQNSTLDSYNKAKAVLDRTVAAYGGVDNLRSIENFSLKMVGETVHRNQSRRTGMSERTPYIYELVVDLKGNRFAQTVRGGYPGGFSYDNGFIVDKTVGLSYDVVRKTMIERPNIPPATMRSRVRTMPQLVILNVVDRASRLRYLGKTIFDRRPHDIVSYANEDGAELSLYVDSATSLLSKIETLGTDPFAGDAVNEVIFSEYRDAGSQKVPHARTTKIAGELLEEVRFEDVSFNATLADDKFRPGPGYKPITVPTPEPITKLGENVYTVNAAGYNVLFVGFKDFIFVMESPGGDGVSKQAIDQIKKTIPGKSIRYLAVTHHHDDHAGGIRTYMAEGATLLALPGEKSFFENVAKSKFTISPDALALKPQAPRIEVIKNGKHLVTDGTMTVELLDIGSGPHTNEMLVAYLPSLKMVFQGDLLNRPANGDYPIANDTTVHFAKWLESSKLPVERIVAVHGPVSTIDELRKAVADKQATAVK